MARRLRIALVGGGIGGLTTALALARAGFEPHVFEQASQLREIGAGISLSPNATKVLRALGLEDSVKARAFESRAQVERDWTTGCTLRHRLMKGVAASRFGAPYLDMHRADLLNILGAAVEPVSCIHLASRCVAVSALDRHALLTLGDGREEEFDLVVGCDGIRSRVREALHGADAPLFAGNMCWRALIPAERLPAYHLPPDVTIWTGPGGHIVTFYVRGGALVNLVAVRETDCWSEESWSVEADPAELVSAFPDVHDDLAILFKHTDICFKWGLFDRQPLKTWSVGRTTLLGDAAHPMLPFLGQGGAMAIEDAYVLSRELARSADDVQRALRAYEAERLPRTTRIQATVRRQAKIFHLRSPAARVSRRFRNYVAGLTDWSPARGKVDWLYEYDATRRASI